MKKIRFFIVGIAANSNTPKPLGLHKGSDCYIRQYDLQSSSCGRQHSHLDVLGITKMGALVIPDKINDNQGTTFTVTEVSGDTRFPCKDVTSVKLPETIVKLGDVCFYGAKLTEINIPKNVAEISHTAWAGLNAVPECKVDGANIHFDSDDDGVLYTENKVELRSVPSSIAAKTSSDTYTVNQSVTSIAKGAFFSNPGLKKVILPSNLQEVEEGWPSIAATKDLEEFVMTPSSTAKYEVKEGVLFKKGAQQVGSLSTRKECGKLYGTRRRERNGFLRYCR
jgi:putative cell surface protein